jgi:hypothetical protein
MENSIITPNKFTPENETLQWKEHCKYEGREIDNQKLNKVDRLELYENDSPMAGVRGGSFTGREPSRATQSEQKDQEHHEA